MKRIFNDTLREYCGKGYYPWHMPGHKRQPAMREQVNSLELDYMYDVTEVPGLDNLNEPEGALKQSMEQLAAVYGSYCSYYLVNGSSCGILAAISAVCKRGDTLILARNCHKSVYHAVALLELNPVYVYPNVMEEYGICGSIRSLEVKEALGRYPEAKAVILPSPTYEGIVSDIEEISRIVHQTGAYLIVDEAHGAHMEFGSIFPQTATRCGADLVIESLHKTLPCYNQCAILHIGKTVANPERLRYRVERYLRVYQTTSPSYLLVANMEDVIAAMAERTEVQRKESENRLLRYREAWKALRWIHLLTREEVQTAGGYDYDRSKLVFCVPVQTGLTGQKVAEQLEAEDGLIVEMASLHYVLAMTSCADTEDGYQRLDQALRKVESGIEEHVKLPYIQNMPVLSGKINMVPGVAWNENTETVRLDQAVGRIAGEYVTVYPPGIPTLVPGESIGEQQVNYLRACIETGLTVYGIEGNDMKIQVLIP